MTPSRPIRGLSFKKLDLHIHTPASKCFAGPCSPQDIVKAALAKGIEAIAITDHNSANWIDAVREAAKGSPLVVFPGVEISCTGGKRSVHILALFDPSKTSKHIEALLNKLDIGPDLYGDQSAVTNMAPIQVIESIHLQQGIAVLAHANSSNGVLADMAGQPRANVIQCPLLLAAEGTDFDDEDKRLTHKRVADLLDGTDATYRRKLAVYQSSDNPCPGASGQHGLDGIGSRVCYFKLESINLDGLRQCFIDPQVRIRHPQELEQASFPRIARVKFNSGFLENQEVHFHDGLTTVLGAKGAGKSLLIEFMRFALNQEPLEPSIAQDHIAKLRSKLGEYGVVELAFVDENGAETTVSRTLRELDGSPYGEDVPFDPAQVLPVLFLSQNEIIKIAEDETEQLKFIDQFFDFRAIRARIASLERDLEHLDSAMAEGLTAYEEVTALGSRISTTEKEVAKLDKALADPIFDNFRKLQEKEKALQQQRDYLSTLVATISQTKDALLAKAVPSVPAILEKDPTLLRASDAIRRACASLAEQLSRLVADIEKEMDNATSEYTAWHPQYVAGRKDYEDYIQKAGGDYKAIAVGRERLVRELSDLQRKRASAEAKKDQVPALSKRRNELLDAVQQQFDLYTRERQTKCEKFQSDSAGKLRLTIRGSSNVQEFQASLLSLKRGSYLRDEEISQITSAVTPRDFVMALLRYHATKESKHLEPTAKVCGICVSRMKTLADFLLGEIPFQDLLALQYRAMPQDRPAILFDIGGGNFQPLSGVSVGQKCTAMLIMALSEGTMPIVIDQPEDSLDIRSIWDDVCTKLRVAKNRRQFIFTTHNSSLAVASDTDCYLVFEGDASHGQLVQVGSMDHEPMSSEVLKYLEGGRDTYELKFAKYGGPARH
jgi:ABC-type cobalamin/Fe3+-siderophores transport system ATPase subunit